jgi:hypothetical protein
VNTIIKSKWVCINSNYVNKELLTEGKVYEIITETSFGLSSFIADNGRSYRIDLDNINEFITLEEWREKQLDKLL